MDPFQNTLATVSVHVATMLLVAGLLWSLGTVAAGRAAAHWSMAWAILAIGLLALRISLDAATYRSFGMTMYWSAQITFGWLVWIGARELSRSRTVRWSEWAFFVALQLTALTSIVGLPLPALAMVVLLVRGWVALKRYQPEVGEPILGLRLTRLALSGLAALFITTAAITALENESLMNTGFWPVYELLLLTGLAFGMVVLAGDRVRGELVRRNRQLAQAKSELERAARTDPLTGLLNRRGLAEIVAEQSTNPYSGSIAVLDLNSFKKLNDQYGHQAGDVALLLVARALRQNLRVTDPIVRTGGDEFVILMPNGELPELEERLERVKLALHDQRLPGVPNPLTLQAAWGTATFQNADEVWPAISQADAAMYRAKATHHQRHPASVEVVAPQGNFSA